MRWRIVLILSILPVFASAQHIFEAGIHGGLSGYSGKHNYVQSMPSANIGIVAAYAYHSQRVVGVRLGVEVNMHRAGYSKTDYEDTYTTIDSESQRMQVDYKIGALKEMYNTWSIALPLQMAFSFPHDIHLYIGPKVVFPLGGTWTEKARNAELSVYYPDYDNRVYESFPLAASRSFGESNSGKISKSKPQVWLTAELCYDWRVSESHKGIGYVSFGIYADYSLMSESITAGDAVSLIMLSDTREGFPLRRILSPVLTSNRQGKALVSKRAMFDVGIKITYRFASVDPLGIKSRSCNCH